MPPTPSEAELIVAALQAAADEMRVGLPGRVVNYSAARNTVDVQPQMRRVLEDADGGQVLEDLPVIPDVPIAWPSGLGGSAFITWPLAVNDPGELRFQDFDPGQWRETGEPATPGDLRTHRLGNAVFWPGLRPNGEVLATAKIHATAVVIGSETRLGVAAAADAMVLGSTFKGVAPGPTNYDGHFHTSPMGPTGGPSNTVPLSTKHKVDA